MDARKVYEKSALHAIRYGIGQNKSLTLTFDKVSPELLMLLLGLTNQGPVDAFIEARFANSAQAP